MYTGSIDYTVCSTDPKRYNRINCNLTAPVTQYSSMVVTCLTANCDIMILERDDYITFLKADSEDILQESKYCFDDDYSNLNAESLASIIDKFLDPVIKVGVDNARRLYFYSLGEFTLTDMSYNTKIVTGFYNTPFPIKSEYYSSSGYGQSPQGSNTPYHIIRAESVGFMLSTPVLYLISNVGMQSYRNIRSTDNDSNQSFDDLCGAKIVMRLNNSFSANTPIIVNNADFTTTLLSNDLSSLEFRLVDAYMHEIKLLSPMYLAITVRAVEEEMIPSAFELMYSRREFSEANGINRGNEEQK